MNSAPFSLLLRLHLHLWRAKIVSLRQQSTLMLTVIWVCVVAYWIFGFQLFYRVLHAVDLMPGIGPWLLERLFYLSFAFLMVMLFFSNIIIGYATLFRNQETQWLLSLPISFANILRWKWLETVILASWAFVFLSGPILLAYGMVEQFSWSFYVKIILLLVPFLVIPATTALLVTLLLARFIPRNFFKIIFVTGSVVMVTGIFLSMGLYRHGGGDFSQLTEQFDRIIGKTQFSSSPFWPSAWLVNSLLFDDWRSLFFFCVLMSNALLLGWFMFSSSGKMFYAAWSRVQGYGVTRSARFKRIAAAALNGLEHGLERVPWPSAPIRSLVFKDVRTFFRDTVQWSQFAIYFGLLGIYILNLRNVSDQPSIPWSHLISFLNLTACLMTLATLTTRFVFPQFSLEGKRLWIVGLAPVGLRKVLWEKFWLSSLGSIAITLTLMLISSLMLKLDWKLVIMFCATVTLMGFGLSGLAVGLGALYPNFKEDNPSKIVSGFGGTICLVLSMTYVTACVGIEALGIKSVDKLGLVGFMTPVAPSLPVVVALSLLVVALASTVTTWLPLRLAFRRLETLEI